MCPVLPQVYKFLLARNKPLHQSPVESRNEGYSAKRALCGSVVVSRREYDKLVSCPHRFLAFGTN